MKSRFHSHKACFITIPNPVGDKIMCRIYRLRPVMDADGCCSTRVKVLPNKVYIFFNIRHLQFIYINFVFKTWMLTYLLVERWKFDLKKFVNVSLLSWVVLIIITLSFIKVSWNLRPFEYFFRFLICWFDLNKYLKSSFAENIQSNNYVEKNINNSINDNINR